MLYASSATQLRRLGIGATNDVLSVVGGIPAWGSTPTLAGLTMTGASTASASLTFADNILLRLGTDGDIAAALNSAGLATNTALTGVLVGTPVTPALAANSLIISNITADGDILIATNKGGNSRAGIFIDGSGLILNLYGDVIRFLNSANGTVKLSVDVGADSWAFQQATTISTTVGALTLAPVAGSLLFTGTLALTGSRVTQSYHTNITSTNAVTVDSSETVKHSIEPYRVDALKLIMGMDVITFEHDKWLDSVGGRKLGIRAESIGELLALSPIYREDGSSYPGLNLYGLAAIQTKALQELVGRVERLELQVVAAGLIPEE